MDTDKINEILLSKNLTDYDQIKKAYENEDVIECIYW